MSLLTRDRWLAANYAATIFTSAFLLFQVQPLVSKHILPWFGGSPAVWTTCMLFFQCMLLAGYVYAHLVARWLRPAQQALLQAAILATALVLLGILPSDRWEPRDGGDPTVGILLVLTVSVGLPFFVLSTTAPLIQAWFARSFRERVPYRLYALSNLGSLLALVSYPLVFERLFDLPRQAWFWSWGFAGYAVLCGLAAVELWREDARGRVSPSDEAGVADGADGESRSNAFEFRGNSPTWWQRVLWLVLPAFGAVAYLATTNHVCTDIAVMPLLWVVPLALYLLTFIIAFDHPRWYRRALLAALTVAAIYGAAVVSRSGPGTFDVYDLAMTGRCLRLAADAYASVAAHWSAAPPATFPSPQFNVSVYAFLGWNLAAMFGVCLLCHGELYRQRPGPSYLTSFYLLIAAGGAAGGLAVTLIAPHVFRTYFEWRLFLFFGCAWAATLVLHKLVQAAFPVDPEAARPQRGWLPFAVLLVLLVPTALVMVDLAEYLQVPDVGTRLRVRNFFGTLAVREKTGDDPRQDALVLYHGVIAHGSQFVESGRRGQPTTYYGTTSGVGRTLNFFRRRFNAGGLKVGAVGLGTGTLAAYIGAGDSITFYEINPAVIELTTSGRWFTYLQDAVARGGEYDVKLGDARLVLERELQSARPPRFHVLVLDAFSGDAIPVHLLTEEAFATYAEHLTEAHSDGAEGALAVHTSNRYLDLEPVVRGAAEQFGLQRAMVHNRRNSEQGIYVAEWIILTRNQELLAELAPFADVEEGPLPPAILWTDQRSNLLDVIK